MKTKKMPAPKRAGTRSVRELRVAEKLMRMASEDPDGLGEILAEFPELSSAIEEK